MKDIKLYYACHDVRNFGDMLSIDICNKLFDRQCVYESPYNCEAAFIGSIMEQFLYPYKTYIHKTYLGRLKKAVKIWGSGFRASQNEIIRRDTDMSEMFYRKLDISAVRGEKTKKRLEVILKRNLDHVVLGDPGLLAADLLEGRNIPKEYKVGIVPHYIDKKESIENIKLLDAVIIDICQEPIKCIEDIAKCEMILSSSLHGMIVADSLGIPNARIVLSNNIKGGDYKYADYYSAFGIEEYRTIDVREEKVTDWDVVSIKESYPMKQEEVEKKKKELYESFPYKSGE